MNALFLNVLGDWVSFGTIYYCLISNYIYRGDHIVPNFEEIWPSGKTKETKKGKFDMDYLTDAMNKGIAGERNKDFTTCGKPKVSFFNFIRNTIRFYIIRPNVYIVTIALFIWSTKVSNTIL